MLSELVLIRYSLKRDFPRSCPRCPWPHHPDQVESDLVLARAKNESRGVVCSGRRRLRRVLRSCAPAQVAQSRGAAPDLSPCSFEHARAQRHARQSPVSVDLCFCRVRAGFEAHDCLMSRGLVASLPFLLSLVMAIRVHFVCSFICAGMRYMNLRTMMLACSQDHREHQTCAR